MRFRIRCESPRRRGPLRQPPRAARLDQGHLRHRRIRRGYGNLVVNWPFTAMIAKDFILAKDNFRI